MNSAIFGPDAMLLAACAGFAGGYAFARWRADRMTVRRVFDQVAEPARFDPASVTNITAERWEVQEWLHFGGASYLLQSPVRLDKFYRAAWHVVYLGAPFSDPYMDKKTGILSKAGVKAVREYLIGRDWAQWRDLSHHGGIEFSEDGWNVMRAAGRKYRPTRPEIDQLRLANTRQRAWNTHPAYAAQ